MTEDLFSEVDPRLVTKLFAEKNTTLSTKLARTEEILMEYKEKVYATTNLVGNNLFSEVDPRVVTKLFICPLCFCKLASREIGLGDQMLKYY